MSGGWMSLACAEDDHLSSKDLSTEDAASSVLDHLERTSSEWSEELQQGSATEYFSEEDTESSDRESLHCADRVCNKRSDGGVTDYFTSEEFPDSDGEDLDCLAAPRMPQRPWPAVERRGRVARKHPIRTGVKPLMGERSLRKPSDSEVIFANRLGDDAETDNGEPLQEHNLGTDYVLDVPTHIDPDKRGDMDPKSQSSGNRRNVWTTSWAEISSSESEKETQVQKKAAVAGPRDCSDNKLAAHNRGECTPCNWQRRFKGCKFGDACTYCHLPHTGRKRTRRKPINKNNVLSQEASHDLLAQTVSDLVILCRQSYDPEDQTVATAKTPPWRRVRAPRASEECP